MGTKSKLGTDPLSWIGDSRGSKPSKQGKPELRQTLGKKKVGRPITSTRKITSTVQEGLPEGWSRATYIVRENYIDKLKAVAYWDRKQIKEVLDEALNGYLKARKVKPLPKDRP